ncbi:MAG: hypothetical protein ACOC80_05135 [Petrotogales bacterium]
MVKLRNRSREEQVAAFWSMKHQTSKSSHHNPKKPSFPVKGSIKSDIKSMSHKHNSDEMAKDYPIYKRHLNREVDKDFLKYHRKKIKSEERAERREKALSVKPPASFNSILSFIFVIQPPFL